MTRWSTGGGGCCTLKIIEPVAERPWLSVTVKGSDFEPGVVSDATVAVYVKTLLPASKNCCVAEPPSAERSAVTVSAVLVGFVPGVTLTVNDEFSPGNTEFGLAVPVAVGFVGTALPIASTEMLSIASACALVVVVPETTE